MKNKCLNAILFVTVLLPLTLFSYQNCSQLNSYKIENLPLQTNFFDTEPLLLEDLNNIRYTSESECNTIADELIFYHPEQNLCAVADDTCEFNFLQKNGYLIASTENCQRAIGKDEMALNSFTRRSPDELGYIVNQNSYCTSSGHRSCKPFYKNLLTSYRRL